MRKFYTVTMKDGVFNHSLMIENGVKSHNPDFCIAVDQMRTDGTVLQPSTVYLHHLGVIYNYINESSMQFVYVDNDHYVEQMMKVKHAWIKQHEQSIQNLQRKINRGKHAKLELPKI